jgi:hypothetical protein
VNHTITKSVKCDSKSNEKQIIDSALNSVVKKDDTGNGKNDKKDVIAFKNVLVFGLVMIGMEIPHQAVHHVFMSEPGDTFHEKKNCYCN